MFRRWLPLLLLAAAPALAAPPEVVRLNETGIDHLLSGRAADAMAAFEDALARLPDRVVLQRNLAAALVSRAEEQRHARKTLDAIDLLDRAIELHPERLRYRVLRGRVRFEAGRPEYRLLARDDYAHVLERAPDHLDALVNLGQIAYMERGLEEAVDHWRRALELRPSDTDVAARLKKAERELKVESAYEKLTARNFLVRYAPSIPAERAATILRLCEEAYGDLSSSFATYPDTVAVTLYTPSEFRSATRMHGWVTGLSDGTIRLTVTPRTTLESLRATIYHELAHHLIRNIAPRTPIWLHEGLAQMAEDKSVSVAEARLRRGGTPQVGELSAQILRQSDPRRVSRFYDLALGFTHFLFEQQNYGGINGLLKSLGEGNTEEQAVRAVYGAGRAELFGRWRDRLRAR